MSKDLRDKAIDFKGKAYVLVSDRVLYFNETYKEGCIITYMISKPEDDLVVFRAEVYPEGKNGRYFTGWSQATWDEGYINKTSAIENCETSAVGRALGFMGIGVIESIASADEINKAQTHPGKKVISPKEAEEKARLAIDESEDLEALMQVSTNVMKSKFLLPEVKAELHKIIQEKTNEFDPTK